MVGSHPQTVSGLVDLVAWLVAMSLLASATGFVTDADGMDVGGGLLLTITALFASVVVWSQRQLRDGQEVWEPTTKRDKWLRPRGSDDSRAIV